MGEILIIVVVSILLVVSMYLLFIRLNLHNNKLIKKKKLEHFVDLIYENKHKLSESQKEKIEKDLEDINRYYYTHYVDRPMGMSWESNANLKYDNSPKGRFLTALREAHYRRDCPPPLISEMGKYVNPENYLSKNKNMPNLS